MAAAAQQKQKPHMRRALNWVFGPASSGEARQDWEDEPGEGPRIVTRINFEYFAILLKDLLNQSFDEWYAVLGETNILYILNITTWHNLYY